jgi:hypothetical protein
MDVFFATGLETLTGFFTVPLDALVGLTAFFGVFFVAFLVTIQASWIRKNNFWMMPWHEHTNRQVYHKPIALTEVNL